MKNKIDELEKYLEYQLLDAMDHLSESEILKRKKIQWDFKKKYGIRLFECNSRDVYEIILKNEC